MLDIGNEVMGCVSPPLRVANFGITGIVWQRTNLDGQQLQQYSVNHTSYN